MSKKENFWIIGKITVVSIAISYIDYLLKGKNHFLNKIMNQDFENFLKHYRGILIALLVLLCIKLFGKICSLFRKSRVIKRGRVLTDRDSIDLTIKRDNDSFAKKVYAIANGYRRENTSSIFRFILWMIERGKNYIGKDLYADSKDPNLIIKGKEKQYYTVEAIPAATDWIIKKALSIAALGFAWYSLYECFKNLNSYDKLGVNLIPEHWQKNVGILVVVMIILTLITTIFIANRFIDGMNLAGKNLRTDGVNKLYSRHFGQFVVDKICEYCKPKESGEYRST